MTSNSAEKRGAARLEHPLLVAYRSVGSFISHLGTNLSRTGVFVNTPRPLPEGTMLRLLVSLPTDKAPCEVNGRVVRTQGSGKLGPPGMAVQFMNPSQDTQTRIDELVSRLRDELGQEKTEP